MTDVDIQTCSINDFSLQQVHVTIAIGNFVDTKFAYLHGNVPGVDIPGTSGGQAMARQDIACF